MFRKDDQQTLSCILLVGLFVLGSFAVAVITVCCSEHEELGTVCPLLTMDRLEMKMALAFFFFFFQIVLHSLTYSILAH